MFRFIANVGRTLEEEKTVVEEKQPPPLIIPDGYFQKEDAELDEWRHKVSQVRASGMAKRAQFRQERAELKRRLTAAQNKAAHRRDTLVLTTPLTEYTRVTKGVRDFIVPGVVAAMQAKLCLHVHAMCVHQEQIRLAKNDHQEIIWWFEDMVKHSRQEQADKEMALMNELVMLKVEMSTLIDEHSVRNSTHALDNVQELAAMAFAVEPGPCGRRRSSKLVAPDKAMLAARRRSSFRNLSGPGMATRNSGGAGRRASLLKLPSRGSAFGKSSRFSSKGAMSMASLARIAVKECNMEDYEDEDDHIKDSDRHNTNNNDDDDAGTSKVLSDIAARRARRLARSPTAEQQQGHDRRSRPVRPGIQRTRSRSLTSMKREGGKRGGKRPSQEGKALGKAIDDSELAESSAGGLTRTNSRSDDLHDHSRRRHQRSITPTRSRQVKKPSNDEEINLQRSATTPALEIKAPADEAPLRSSTAEEAPRRGRAKGRALERTRSKSLTSARDERRAGKKPTDKTQDDSGLLRGFGNLPPIELDAKFVGKRQPVKPKPRPNIVSDNIASDDFESDDDEGPAEGLAGKFRSWTRAVQDRFGDGKQKS